MPDGDVFCGTFYFPLCEMLLVKDPTCVVVRHRATATESLFCRTRLTNIESSNLLLGEGQRTKRITERPVWPSVSAPLTLPALNDPSGGDAVTLRTQWTMPANSVRPPRGIVAFSCCPVEERGKDNFSLSASPLDREGRVRGSQVQKSYFPRSCSGVNLANAGVQIKHRQ